MTPAQRIFKTAIDQKLEEFRKAAFVPIKSGQASGPGGAAVGAMDPSMPPGAAGAMDPAAMGGAPPMDPAAMGGAPPMDPAAMGGAPPMDMSAMGAPPPMDMSAMGAPPASGSGVTVEDADIVDKITKRTLDTVRQTLEMVGKAKPPASADASGASAPAVPADATQPNVVTGNLGKPPATAGSKTASVLSRYLTLK